MSARPPASVTTAADSAAADDEDELVDRTFYTMGESEEQAFILPDDKPAHRPAKRRKGGLGRDQDEWETALLVRSGAAREDGAWDDDEEERRAQIVVKANRPSFVTDTVGLAKAELVDVVKDRSSDLAKAAEKGSMAVKLWREKTARGKMRHKYWELGGSEIGKAIGDKTEANYGQAQEEDPSIQVAETLKRSDGAPTAMPSQQDVKKINQALPISKVLPELLRTVREHQIVVVVGETGSGKTTRLPIALWLEGGLGHGVVACTQPRRVAAMSVANRVAEEYGTPVGQEVGYSIRFEDCTSNKTKVKYMTDGVLLRESLKDPELEKYSCIVMDEAHERSLNTDILFGIMKRIVRARRDFHLVVTSATLDADRFADFFGGAAIFRIPGRTYKVETYFARTPVVDYVEAAVKQVLQIHLTLPPGDILVFMTGQEDITATCELIAEKLEEILQASDDDQTEQAAAKRKLKREQLLILPMYATLPADMQMRIFQPAKPGQRKCVVSTNVAETSLTVDGIRFVVDSGFTKTNVYNPKLGMDSLRLIPISRAAANQRAGRAGRTQEGFCYRLFTDYQFANEMLPSAVPEIQRTNLGNVVLLLKSLGVERITDFDFMDPPPAENILDSMHGLWVLGALDDLGNLTALGRRMVEFPLDPALSKMILVADNLGCTSEIATVVSMLSVPDVFFRPPERQEESDAARERFLVPESDHLTLLNVFNQWTRHKQSTAWCAQHFIHAKAMRRAKEVREQLVDVMKKQGIPEREVGPTAWDAVRKTVCASYFSNSARLKGVGTYVNMLNGLPAHLHPSSALFGLGYTPDYVVYHEMVLTTKEYMRQVTAVEGEWLAELGPVFFSLRGAKSTPSTAVAAQPLPVKTQVNAAAPPAAKPAVTVVSKGALATGTAAADAASLAREALKKKAKKWG